ncbi:MAG: hypothetical protein K2J33_01810, partial [Alistipes sp.]|nr:hypothetical protein [Alistipes sp.]
VPAVTRVASCGTAPVITGTAALPGVAGGKFYRREEYIDSLLCVYLLWYSERGRSKSEMNKPRA